MSLHDQANYAISLIRQYGIHDFTLRFFESLDTRSRNDYYSKHLSDFFPTKEELEQQRVTHFAYEPLISIVVPAYETDEHFLRQLVDGVLGQTYANLELCIADGSKTDKVKNLLEQEYTDSRINYTRLTDNGGISKNTNEGFKTCHGEYIALLDHDDLLTEHALFEMVQKLNSSAIRPDMIYSDEDKTTADTGLLNNPTFKSDYNEEFIRRINYFCHFLMFSKDLLARVGGLDSNYDGAQDFEFVLRCSAAGANIAHVSKILYHWRVHPASTAFDPGSKLYAYENGAKAIRSYLSKKGEEAEVTLNKDLGFYNVKYYLKNTYQVTVFAHSHAQVATMQKLQPEQSNITVHYEVVAELTDSIIREAAGDYIVLASPMVVPASKNWLEDLLRFCQWERVGITGAKHLNSRQRVENCGYTYNSKGQAAPLFKGLRSIYRGYCHRADGPENVSAVSLDLCMMRKDAYLLTDGIDFTQKSPMRDMDLCFQMLARSRQVILNTDVHASVPNERRASSIYELPAAFQNKWSSVLCEGDPAYSPNLSLTDGAFKLSK